MAIDLEELKAADLTAECQSLRMQLADTEALEISHGERIIKQRETIAAQAAVIEKLREALMTVKPHVQCDPYAVVIRALSIPDDSAQVLKEWLDNVMGEPVAWMADDEDGVCEFVESYFVEMAGGQLPFPNNAVVTPLFRKPAL